MSQFKPKSLVVYRIQKALELDKLDEQLSELKYTPCGPNDMARSGWIPPLGEDVELLKHESNNLILLTVKHESKILPPATIKEIVRTRVQKLEKEQNRRLKKMEIQAVNDAVLAELIPKAFSKYSTTNIWVDTKSRLLLVETTSHKKADDVTALLRKTIGSLPIIPFTLETPVELTLTEWVKTGSLPPGLALCDEATLKDVLENGGVVTTKRQDLICDEIAHHIEAGKLVTKVALGWMNQMFFILNDNFIFSRLTFTEELIEQNDDISPEDHAQRFDADFVLFTSVVMEVLDTMIKALGGESPGLITTPSDEPQGVAAEAKQPEKTFH